MLVGIIFFWVRHVVYLYLSSSSDKHHLLHSCLGTGMRVGTKNKFCHYRASLVHSASFIVSCCCWCLGGSSITIMPLLVQIIRTFAIVTMFVQRVLVNTLRYHDTVDFAQDSETEDPHLCFSLLFSLPLSSSLFLSLPLPSSSSPLLSLSPFHSPFHSSFHSSFPSPFFLPLSFPLSLSLSLSLSFSIFLSLSFSLSRQ